MVVYAREIDYINRDPNGINENIHVLFREVLAEPERGLHSMNCVWRYSAKIYRGVKNCCYSFITYLLGIPISIYWGCVFACASFFQIWCCTPIVRMNSICCNLVLFYNIIMSSVFLAPLWEARAYFLKRINVTYSTGQIPAMTVIERVFSGNQYKGQYKPVNVPPLKVYNTTPVNNTPREYVYDTSPRNYNSQRYDNSPREYQPAQQPPQQYKQQYQPQQPAPQQQYQPQQQQYQPQAQQYRQAAPQQSYRQQYDQAPPSRQYQPPANSYRAPNTKSQNTYRQAAPQTTRDYVQQQHNPAKPNRNYEYPAGNSTRWK